MTGKGSKPRPMSVSKSTFNENFDRIFSKKRPTIDQEKVIEEIEEYLMKVLKETDNGEDIQQIYSDLLKDAESCKGY